MKTIKDLNDKAWYRFLKVFYTVFFTIVAMVVVYITFEIVGAHEEDYSVTCNYGNKSKFLAYKDKKINVSYHFDYKSNSERLSDSSTADIVKACGISLKENEDILYYIYNGTFDGPRRFDLEKIKVTDLSDSLFLIPGFLIIFFIAEIVRRVFYYIVLGSLTPKKN